MNEEERRPKFFAYFSDLVQRFDSGSEIFHNLFTIESNGECNETRFYEEQSISLKPKYSNAAKKPFHIHQTRFLSCVSNNRLTCKLYDCNVTIREKIFRCYSDWPLYLKGFWDFFFENSQISDHLEILKGSQDMFDDKIVLFHMPEPFPMSEKGFCGYCWEFPDSNPLKPNSCILVFITLLVWAPLW